MNIKENMIIKTKTDINLRVLHINHITTIVYVIDMDGTRWPNAIKEKELKSIIFIIKEDEAFKIVIDEELSDVEIKKRDLAFEVITYIFNELEEEMIYISKYRLEVIKKAALMFDISINTVKKYLIKYWQGGSVKNSLVPNYYKCGAKGKERRSGKIKRGRPRINGDKKGVNIDDNIKNIFGKGIRKYYYNERKNSLKTTYELIIKDFYTKEKVTQYGTKIPLIQDITKLPSYSQFLYWFKKLNNVKEEVSNRSGSRVYQQAHRTIIGDSTQDAGIGPATLWQIDSTIFDIYLVSSFNRDLIVGRPVLYLIIDVYSRMIVGMNVTFESFNAFTGAMVALSNSMISKKEFCNEYEIKITEDEWPVECVPQKILADRGELMGFQIENAITNLGIAIQNSPPYRADYKGIIEQSFRVMNLRVKPFVDGAVIDGKNIRERGEKDYRLKANLTIEEFTKIIIKCVLFHNNNHVLSSYVLDEMMVEESVAKIPIKIWQHGINTKKGKLRRLPEDFIKLSLLPTDIASVTSRGVSYKKMLYVSEYALKNNWFGIARNKGSWKVRISYDPRNLTDIYVVEDKGRNHHKLTLLEHHNKFSKKDYVEIEHIIKHEQSQQLFSKEKELQKKVELYSEIEEIVSGARRKTESEEDVRKSKSEKLSDIHENRRSEKEFHRGKLKNESQEQVSENREVLDAVIENVNEELDLFRQIQNLEEDNVNV